MRAPCTMAFRQRNVVIMTSNTFTSNTEIFPVLYFFYIDIQSTTQIAHIPWYVMHPISFKLNYVLIVANAIRHAFLSNSSPLFITLHSSLKMTLFRYALKILWRYFLVVCQLFPFSTHLWLCGFSQNLQITLILRKSWRIVSRNYSLCNSRISHS